MAIKKLPNDVQNILQSGVVITDATQCVLELIYNSLDAKATAIAVRTDLKKFYVQVVDNGIGISCEDLQLLGKRYVTSKCRSIEELETNIASYGYRGVAISSISDMCDRLEIQSRHSSSKRTFTKILKNGESNEIYENKRMRPTQGTTVTVFNFMVSMPVRRKRVKEVFDIDFIIQNIEALSILYYHVSFSLRNDTTGKVLLQTYRRENVHQALTDRFELAQEKILIPILFKQGGIEVSGFVSRHLHTDCSIQFIFANNRVIHNDKIHKLTINLIKKYADIWGRDRENPEEVIDVDGFIYVVKIQCPYLNFFTSRNGRKTIAEFRNTEDVFKCVIRAIKRPFKINDLTNDSDVSVYFSKPGENTKSAKNPSFGPSQMNNVVHGRHVSRPIEQCEEAATQAKQVEENIAVGNFSLTNYRLATPTFSALQQYQRDFFNENNKDGSNLPDRVPLYEMHDFSHIPFHEFLAWLSMKAKVDDNALKLLTELSSENYENKSKNTTDLVSLKDIRREKVVARSRLMLKKIKEVQFTCRKICSENQENYPRGIMRSIARTPYLRTNPTQIKNWVTGSENRYELPQATFNEFLTWLKVKTAHNTTVEKILGEFFSVKCHLNRQSIPLPISVKELRKEKLLQINQFLLDSLKKQAMKRESVEAPKTNKLKRRQFCQDAEKATKNKKHTREFVERKKADECNDTLLLTWKSHYRTESGRVRASCKETVKYLSKNDCIRVCDQNSYQRTMGCMNAPNTSRGLTPPVSIYCEDVLQDSPEESVHNGNAVDNIQGQYSEHPHFVDKALSPINIYFNQCKEQAVQTSCDFANAEIQVNLDINYVTTSTQTEEKNSLLDKETQTTVTEYSMEGSKHGQITNKEMNLSQPTIPEILPQSIMNSSSFVLRESLPDTVPVSPIWEEKTDEDGRKCFVHISSGFSTFDPPACSTRSSYTIFNIKGDKSPSRNNDEVQEVVTNSCQDDLADVKWQNGNKDDVVDPILKILQDASAEAFVESGIISGKILTGHLKSHKLLSSLTFSPKTLKSAKVIGQLDRKFIVALVTNQENPRYRLICLFDQHGVDERVNLEELFKQYYSGEKCESEALPKPVTLSVPLNTYNMFVSEIKLYNKHGLYGVALTNSAISMESVPSCFMRQLEREVKAHRKTSLMRKIAELVEEITEHLSATRGAGLTMPKTIMGVIASEACRSAIKFNQVLSLEKMSKMINDLSECNMPFQCAHGRPSVTPVFELGFNDLSILAPKLNYKKLRTMSKK